MFRNVARERQMRPGYKVVYPNRGKASSKLTKLIVFVILLASVALMLIVTIGGWSKLQGLKPVNIAWCIVYLLIAYYILRWNRGLLPIAAALAILLLIVATIAGTGAGGVGWFDRNHVGFASAHTLFGGTGLDPDMLGLVTLVIAPVQVLLIIFAMRGFSQGWNVEVEAPVQDGNHRRHRPESTPRQPAVG
jgi:hypothetical protein